MKILMLVNWKIDYVNFKPAEKQAADYYVYGEPYWFFKYFTDEVQVDVVDFSSITTSITRFEKNVLHFHIIQGIKAIAKIKNYDCVVSHGMPSAVVVGVWRRFVKTNCKHIVYDIGCFNSAAQSGMVMRLMQFVSKSFDGLIYHAKIQKEYYEKFYPWLLDKAEFIPFGADYSSIDKIENKKINATSPYIICVGGGWRDRKTLIEAYEKINTDVKLRFVGQIVEEDKNRNRIEQVGRVSFVELIHQIDGAQLCVLPLIERNFSYGLMTLLDQMARGKCVIASRVSSLTDYADDGETVVFYEPENVDDCKEKIEKMLNNPQKACEIGVRAKKKIKLICSEKKMAEESEIFIKKVLDKKSN